MVSFFDYYFTPLIVSRLLANKESSFKVYNYVYILVRCFIVVQMNECSDLTWLHKSTAYQFGPLWNPHHHRVCSSLPIFALADQHTLNTHKSYCTVKDDLCMNIPYMYMYLLPLKTHQQDIKLSVRL